MFTDKKLLLALCVSGWAVLSTLGKCRKNSRHLEKKLRKKELHVWEGEGGNLPPGVGINKT
jgi:hypothetical protein